ncbi:MAG: sigma-70 family RNA polymerase sigma factor [candidate division Zixibacteria bacterium]|nr:sigma-70 family RNA polymerase sigma factor [candidate division Zixibacteria bacterium]
MSGSDDKHPPEAADFDLVVAAQKGDNSAYDCLVRRYQRQVYRWAFHVVRTHDLADEVTQDVFVRTYEALARIDPNRPFGAWLCRTTVNIALNLLRKNQFRAQQILLNRPDPSDYEREAAQPEASFRRRRLLARLEAEIDRLPEVYRTIILLRLRDALTYEEIREALGVSMGTVMSRLARARRKLREALGDFLEDLRE